MSDDVVTFEGVLAEFRRERSFQPGETPYHTDVSKRIAVRIAKERDYLRTCILEMASGEVPDAEVTQRLRRMAEDILIREAAFAEWRLEYWAQFVPGGGA